MLMNVIHFKKSYCIYIYIYVYINIYISIIRYIYRIYFSKSSVKKGNILILPNISVIFADDDDLRLNFHEERRLPIYMAYYKFIL